MHLWLALALVAADPVTVYPVDGSEIGVAWGNGTDAPESYYRPLFRSLNKSGISVAAATTGQAGDGKAIILAGELLAELGCERIVAMGHSQGGGGATRAAAARPDLFDAVCPIMPARGDVGWLPCFVVSGERDRLAPAATVARNFVRFYPGPILHAERRGVNHYQWDDAEIMARVTLFALDGEIDLDRRWRVLTDRY